MKVLIAAGGSGGHIFPAIALARRLREKDAGVEMLFVGSNKVLDKRIFEKEGFRSFLISANKMPYKLSLGTIPFLVRLLFDTIASFFLIVSYRPAIVVGFGGYVSWPVVFVSSILGIPRIVHEQNVVPGRANNMLFGFADRIALSFEDTKRFLGKNVNKAFFTGNPIRDSVFNDDRPGGIKRFGLSVSKFTILVVGGSQGSHFLNETFVKAISNIGAAAKNNLQVIHITGVKDFEWVAKAYKDMGIENSTNSFVDRIEDAYSASDLIITRSGASAMFEAAYFGRPMILIPYPFAMSHQAENAKVFSDKGAAIMLEENKMSADIFKETLSALLADSSRLDGMGKAARLLSVPGASDNLAGEIMRMGGRN